MTTDAIETRPDAKRLPRGFLKRLTPGGITALAMLAIFGVCISLQPQVMSVNGLNLILSSMLPLVFASLAQMLVMSAGDIDLGIGAFVGLISAVSATALSNNGFLGLLMLLGFVLAYGLLGILIEWRKVPSLIATLGASFVWIGLGLFLLPRPGGAAPDLLRKIVSLRLSWFPVPLLIIILGGLGTWFFMQRMQTGAKIRALGSNKVALRRWGNSGFKIRGYAYLGAGVLGVLAGLFLAGEIGGGDVMASADYTLISVAAVILGGGTFYGGRAPAWGTVFGAVTFGLLTVLLSFMSLSSTLQPAIQGGIVILALAGRLIVEKVIK